MLKWLTTSRAIEETRGYKICLTQVDGSAVRWRVENENRIYAAGQEMSIEAAHRAAQAIVELERRQEIVKRG